MNDSEELTNLFLENVSGLGEKFGAVLMQLHNNMQPRDLDRIEKYLNMWDKDVPLYVEVRQADRFSDAGATEAVFDLLESHQVGSVIVDTAGRRDLMHMRLTVPTAYIRWVACGADEIDNRRLVEWAEKIAEWNAQGVQGAVVAIHEHEPKRIVPLARIFIERLNALTGTTIHLPHALEPISPTRQA